MKRRSLFAALALPVLGLASKVRGQPEVPETLSLRTIKILKDGVWVDAEWKDIKKDVTFRMFEATGGMVVEVADRKDPTIYSAWVAKEDAQPLPKEQGSWCVSVVGAPGFIVV